MNDYNGRTLDVNHAMLDPTTDRYGSDLIVEYLAQMGIEYVAFNPGATFRGIHDSLVQRQGTGGPQIIECLHEEISVAIAHGYAKATGKPMAVLTHNVVGLMHASMAIFNAWCDRVPMLVLGGTGPMDTSRRRPGIDWIHTALVQGNLVRDYVKWDDQPYSLAGVRESLLRGYRLSVTEPKGPVYICFDAGIQEQKVDTTFFDAEAEDDAQRLGVTKSTVVDSAAMTGVTIPPQIPGPALQEIARLLVGASKPVAIADQVGRQPKAFEALVQLAELLSMPVIEPPKRVSSLNFPTAHKLNLSGLNPQVLQDADLVLALEVEDLYGVLHEGEASRAMRSSVLTPGAKIISIGLKEMQKNSLIQGYQRFQPVNMAVNASVSQALPALVGACRDLIEEKKEKLGDAEGWRLERREQLAEVHHSQRNAWQEIAQAHGQRPHISRAFLALQLGNMLKHENFVLANGSLKGWVQRLWELDQPYQWLGGSGGAGLGYGLGAALGAALAYRGHDTMIIDLQADGDFLFTPSALWTAAHYRLPVLIIMDNNRGYFNSVDHQNKVAALRGRPRGNAAVGTLIQDPSVDFATLARSFGVYAEGPITDPAELAPALERVLKVIKTQKRPVLLDVVTSAS